MVSVSNSTGFSSSATLFSGYEPKVVNIYVTQEFQDYGYRLAAELNDLSHKSLYIKMAKNEDRQLLESARSYVLDADSARSKARLFMWKFKELKMTWTSRSNQSKLNQQKVVRNQKAQA